MCVLPLAVVNPNALLALGSPAMKIEDAEKGVVPVQRLFYLEEKDQKKIKCLCSNSAAKCARPARHGYNAQSHLNLLSLAFDINLNLGGACGKIVTLKRKHPINPLVAARTSSIKCRILLISH